MRYTRFPGTVALLIVIVLAAGCYRPITTDIPPTPGAEEEEDSTPSTEDVIATSRAEATRAAETAGDQAAEEPTTEPPAPEAPTPAPEEPSPVPEAPTTEAEPPPTAVPTTASQPQPQPTASSGIHVVQAGENLFRIALRYNTTVDAIVAANNLDDETQIYVGQRLIIPGADTQPAATTAGETTYVVKRGDNLYRIALAFGLTYQQLAQYNGITDPNDIYVGQVLRIPPRPQ
jgi:LysM repeat protein